MHKTPTDWSKVSAELVVQGSRAQATNVLQMALDDIAALAAALEAAVRVADEARDEWDAAPSGMRAGKLLIALSGNLPRYRADIDAIHAVRSPILPA